MDRQSLLRIFERYRGESRAPVGRQPELHRNSGNMSAQKSLPGRASATLRRPRVIGRSSGASSISRCAMLYCYNSTRNEPISAEPVPNAVGTEIRYGKYSLVLGIGTSQTSMASLCEDMYATARSLGRKPEMGINLTPHTAARPV